MFVINDHHVSRAQLADPHLQIDALDAERVLEQLRLRAAPTPSQQHPPLNPLSGGWQNRLCLALQSQLPNEIDWAFNQLVTIPVFYIGYIPMLAPTLLSHLQFDQLQLITSKQDFTTETVEMTLEQWERTFQVLHVFRNLSFMHENTLLFAKDTDLLMVIAKGLALPDVDGWVAVKGDCLDIFENLCRIYTLRGANDFYLACLKRMIRGDDRSKISILL